MFEKDMPPAAVACYKIGALRDCGGRQCFKYFATPSATAVIAGMCLGEYMGANNNFQYAPVHAHINLIGWVTLALCGTFYTLTRDTYSPRLAWITFGLIATGVLVMIPTLSLLLKTGDSATWGPLAGLAGGIVLLGMLAFAISVFGELVRKRP